MIPRVAGPIAIFLLLCCPASRGAAAQDPAPSAIKRAVNAVVVPLRRKYRIPGMAVAVALDGRNYFLNYGIASKQTRKPVTDRTLFEIGSVSKTFAATLASDAQVRGLLSLNDPVSKFLPPLRGGAFDKITLLNLATHTSGLPLFVPAGIRSNAQLMDYLEKWHPPFPAGTHRIYSNIGVGLLGVIAAKRMHEPYVAALQNGLFRQLGMKRSYIDVPPSRMRDYAQGYTAKNAPVRMRPGALAAEAYGVKSCTADLIRFLEENMGLLRLGAPLRSAIRNTHSGYFKSDGFTQALVWEEYPYPVSSARLRKGNSAVFHESVATRLIPSVTQPTDMLINKSGSTSGFSAYVAFIPAEKIGIVLLANKAYPMNAEVTAALQILKRILAVTN